VAGRGALRGSFAYAIPIRKRATENCKVPGCSCIEANEKDEHECGEKPIHSSQLSEVHDRGQEEHQQEGWDGGTTCRNPGDSKNRSFSVRSCLSKRVGKLKYCKRPEGRHR